MVNFCTFYPMIAHHIDTGLSHLFTLITGLREIERCVCVCIICMSRYFDKKNSDLLLLMFDPISSSLWKT